LAASAFFSRCRIGFTKGASLAYQLPRILKKNRGGFSHESEFDQALQRSIRANCASAEDITQTSEGSDLASGERSDPLLGQRIGRYRE
jgi:hypothetical protein